MSEYIKQKLVKARVNLRLRQPFFGELSLRLRLIEDETCTTGWTDGTHLGYNPKWVEKQSHDELVGFFAHEVMHLALHHMIRAGNRNHIKWNQAADYSLNNILKECDFKLPQGALINPAYKDMSAEQIYDLIPDNPDNNSAGMWGEVRPATNKDGKQPSPAELTEIKDKWKVAVAQAAQAAKMRGNMPGALKRFVEEIIEPKVDWRILLRRFVEETAKNDYQMFPPNKRYVWQGLYLPTMKSEELPPIVLCIDTSGSISKDDLKQFAGELTAILEYFTTTLTVMYCDTKVYKDKTQVFTRNELPVTLNAHGGGGTDFRSPFSVITEEDLQPLCFIYLTDMCCNSFPKEIPDYPVLWIKHGKYPCPQPPFGELIEME